MSDPNKWPENPDSNIVNPTPWWRNVQLSVWMKLTNGEQLELLAQVSESSLLALTKPNACPPGCEQIAIYAKRILNGESPKEEETDLIKDVTTLTDRLKDSELARAALNPLSLVMIGAKALSTGMFGSSPLTGRERIEIWKTLMAKSIADAKSIDRASTSEQMDRKSRSLKDTTKAELAKMSENELRDLIAKAKEEGDLT